jgi:hypothetical protein
MWASPINESFQLTQESGGHPVLRIRDDYPGSQNSNKREGWKKLNVIPFHVATNFTKLKIMLVLKWWRKKFGQIVTKHSKKWVWDPGSEIRDPEKMETPLTL